MKTNKKISVLVLIIILINNLWGEEDVKMCSTPSDPKEILDLSQLGGKYITSEGELKVLIVFTKFADDTLVDPDWPLGNPPLGWEIFIDQIPGQNSTNYANLTHYFDEMSLSSFKVIGDVYYIESQHPHTDYSMPNPGRAEANRDVLMQLDSEQNINFADYDNWEYIDAHTHQNNADGLVDMIFMIWRGGFFGLDWSGEASLGYFEDPIMLDGVTIGFGFPPPTPGSGVTVQFHFNQPIERVLKTAVHELGHWLITSYHPYPFYNVLYAIWGILGNSFHSGQCANAFERHQLGWINAINVTNVTAPMADYITQGVAYRYHPPNGQTNEYYYFENHRRISIYDDATLNPEDKGIFILHAQNAYNSTNNIKCLPSEGNYDWNSPECVENIWDPTGPEIPAFQMISENKIGRNKREKLPAMVCYPNGPTQDWMHVLFIEPNNYLYGAFFKGVHSTTSFGIDTRSVLSPWSNPPAYIWGAPTSANISLEILNENEQSGVVTVHFYLTNPEDSKPACPQNFTLQNVNDHPYLTWDVNSEPDINSYILHRINADPDVFYITHPSNSFLDQDVNISQYGTDIGYFVEAEDSSGKISDQSPNLSIHGYVGKMVANDLLPIEYYLSANIPNPFNPVTSIQYGLPENSEVELVVYDLMGRVVRTLVSGSLEAGYRQVDWDGTNAGGRPAASGMYIYRLTAISLESEQTFTKTGKMVLLR